MFLMFSILHQYVYGYKDNKNYDKNISELERNIRIHQEKAN